MWPPQNPQFSPRKTRKGKSKQKAKGNPSPSSAPNTSAAPPPPPPPPEPYRNIFFPTYPSSSSSSSTPLPPPSMPKKSFLRRIVPLFLTANLAVGGYVLMRTKKQPSEKDEETRVEVSSIPIESIDATVADKTAH